MVADNLCSRVVTNPILNLGTEKNSQFKSEPDRKQYFQAYTKMEPLGIESLLTRLSH